MCTEKKTTRIKRKYHLIPSSPATVLLIAEKQQSLTLNFSDFQFVFIKVLWKIKRNCMSGLFCIANLLEVDRKKAPPKQNEVKYSSHNKY